MTTMQKVGTYGSAWQTESGAKPPTIYGNVQRDLSTVTGVCVGVSAVSTSKEFDRHEVTADPDAVVVPRQFDEPFYRGLDDSLVQRTAQLHGTSRAWMLVYD